MEQQEAERVVAFLTGIACGVAIGAGVALLVAPASGRKTRRRLRKAAGSFKEVAGERWDDVADDVRNRVEDVLEGAKRRFAN